MTARPQNRLRKGQWVIYTVNSEVYVGRGNGDAIAWLEGC